MPRGWRELANQHGPWTGPARHFYEIGIRGNQGIAVLAGPLPNRPVIRLRETNVTHMGQAGE